MEFQGLLSEAQTLSPQLTDLRRRLHASPEIGFDLPQTREMVCRELTRLSLPFRFMGRGSIVVDLGPKNKGFTLLRADMDALPLAEETDLPFRSKNGAMHACGHDLHTTALLGALALLKERQSLLRCPVRCLFQPAEELLQGARDAVDAGVLEGVKRAYMLHVTLGTGLKVGTVVIPPGGIVAPAADFFQILLEGRGGHGADPSASIDPLPGAAQILLALQNLPAREIPSHIGAAVTVGTLRGGDSFNVIPNCALLQGSVRCFDESLQEKLKERIECIASALAQAYRLNQEVSFPAGCPALQNDEKLRTCAEKVLSRVLKDRVLLVDTSDKIGGSEDFALISRNVPSLMLALAAGNSSYPLHHPKAEFDEDCLPFGSAALAALALAE